jgi:hypothetical protein
MPRLRLICAVLVLVFAPFVGAFAVAHHHCNDAWHGHAQGTVAAEEDCDSHAPNLVLANCDECQAAFAAVPLVGLVLAHVGVEVPVEEDRKAALARYAFSLFRPPKV